MKTRPPPALTAWFITCVFAASCGGSTGSDTVDDAIECTLPEGPVARQTQAIVNGSALWDASVVDLSSGESLAVGAVVTEGYWGLENSCTGTVVGDQVVLTAAHCVTYDNGTVLGADELWFAVGADVSQASALFTVDRVDVHPRYDHFGYTAVHDVAVLTLAESAADRVPELQPLPVNCDGPPGPGLVGTPVQVVGYGYTDVNAEVATTRRMWAVETVVDLSPIDFTVDGNQGEQGVCYGDSGGPGLWTIPGSGARIIGLLSQGDELCAHQDQFVRTDTECDFIEPFLPSCGDVTETGSCNGEAAVYCEAGVVKTVDCAALEQTCGPDQDARSRCTPRAADPCGGETASGRCDGTDVVWCEGGEIRTIGCAACGMTCRAEPGKVAACVPLFR